MDLIKKAMERSEEIRESLNSAKVKMFVSPAERAKMEDTAILLDAMVAQLRCFWER